MSLCEFITVSFHFQFHVNSIIVTRANSSGTTDSGAVACAFAEGIRRTDAVGDINTWPDSSGLHRSGEAGPQPGDARVSRVR